MNNAILESPQITTIIPTYSRSSFLEKAIESILKQTYSNFKLVILDNHSEDNTEEVVKKFQSQDSRIHYFRHSYNMGMMKNYEYGFSIIDTPYFHFLSDDDYILPDFYSFSMETFAKHPEIGFYAGSTKIVSSSNEIIRIPNNLWPKEGYWTKQKATVELIGKYPVPTTVVFSKKILHGLSPDFSNNLHWDCDFLLRISIKSPIYIDKRVLGVFISHENSFSKMPDVDLVFNSFHRMRSGIRKALDLGFQERTLIEKKIKFEFACIFKTILLQLIMKEEHLLVKNHLKKLRADYNLIASFFFVLVLHTYSKIFPFSHQLIPLLRKIKRVFSSLFSIFKKQNSSQSLPG